MLVGLHCAIEGNAEHWRRNGYGIFWTVSKKYLWQKGLHRKSDQKKKNEQGLFLEIHT
jgi:hypothetical protein